jgi:hypothetical protein
MRSWSAETVPFLGFALVSLELSEGRLDRIEIGAVGWQEAQLSAGTLDELTHCVELVGGNVLHDHNVAALGD